MKNIKTVLCLLLTFVIVFSLAGCMPGKPSGDGDIKFDSKKWDKSKMHGLPAPKAKVETAVSSKDATTYAFSEMKKKDANDYIDKIKSAGFIYNSVSIGDFSYTGTNEDGQTVVFVYDEDSGNGSVTYAKGEKPSNTDVGESMVIGDGTKWDSKAMGGLPKPDAKLKSYTATAEGAQYFFEGLKKPKDYVEIIKETGFDVDVYEQELGDMILFSGNNADGDQVSFTWTNQNGTITFIPHS